MTGAFDSKLRPTDTGGRTGTGVSVSVSLSVDERGAGLCRRCGGGKGRRQGQRTKGQVEDSVQRVTSDSAFAASGLPNREPTTTVSFGACVRRNREADRVTRRGERERESEGGRDRDSECEPGRKRGKRLDSRLMVDA